MLRILTGRGRTITKIPQIGNNGTIAVSRPSGAECHRQRDISALCIRRCHRDWPLVSVLSENTIAHTIRVEWLVQHDRPRDQSQTIAGSGHTCPALSSGGSRKDKPVWINLCCVSCHPHADE